MARTAASKADIEQVHTPNSGVPATVVNGYADVPVVHSELDGFLGYEDMSPSNFIIPRVNIIQPTSKVGTPGTLRINLTGDEFKALDVMVIKCVQGRVWWDKNNPSSEQALCRSFDFYRPDSSIESPPSSLCAKKVPGTRGGEVIKVLCPKAAWGENKERPDCGETFNLLCILTDDQLPFWISLRGTSIAPVKKYLSAIAIRRQALWLFETTLSLEERTNNGRHYVANFSSPKAISKEMEHTMTPIVIGLRDADLRRTIEAEEMPGAHDDSIPGGMPEDEPGYGDSLARGAEATKRAAADASDWINEQG